jgi:WD40 repeat protein
VDQGHTATGAVLGTPSYMAPEQAAGNTKDIGPATDVYALGALLYELLTGRPPFRAASVLDTLAQVRDHDPVPPRRLQPGTPRALEVICLKCLQKDPPSRYGSAADLGADLGRFLNGEPIQARPAGAWERVVLWARRRPAVAALAASLLAVAALGLAGVTWEGLRADTERRAAQQAQRRAEDEEARARRAQEEAELGLHFNRLALAQHEFAAFNAGQAALILDQCPPERRDWEWYYLYRQCHRYLFRLTGPTRTINDLAYSPDGAYLAAACGDWRGHGSGEVVVWEAKAGAPPVAYRGQPENVLGLAFHPDGHRLALAGREGAIHVWQWRRQPTPATPAQVLRGHDATIVALAYSPCGTWLASAGTGGRLCLWDVRTGSLRWVLSGHTDDIFVVRFSPDGGRLASASRDRTVRVWDLTAPDATGPKSRVLPCGNGVQALAFSPDGHRLAAGCGKGPVLIFDLSRPGAEPLASYEHAGGVSSLAFSPDGKGLAWCGRQGRVEISDVLSGVARQRFRGHRGPANRVAFSPDGKRLASGGVTDPCVLVWDAAAEPDPRSFLGHSAWVVGLAFDPDGRRLALAGGANLNSGRPAEQTVRLWDLARREYRDFRQAAAGWFTSVAFHPDGRRLAAGSDNHTATIWDTRTGQVVQTLKGHTHRVTDVAFRPPDGALLATAGADGNIKFWETATGKVVGTLTGHDAPVTRLAFSPDGKHLASAGEDRTVRCWDLEGAPGGGRLARVLRGHAAAVTGVAFSPDGRYVASASVDQVLKIWEVATGRETTALQRVVLDDTAPGPVDFLGPARGVPRLAFCPRGRRVASTSPNRPVQLWDVPTGHKALALPILDADTLCLAFSPTGRYLAAATGSILYLWDRGE